MTAAVAASSVAKTDDSFDFRELVKPELAIFATIAGLLVTAEGSRTVPGRAVQTNDACPQSSCESARLPGFALDIGRQAIGRVIRDLGRFILA